MATVLGTDHTNEKLSIAGCLELLDDIYTHLDEPMADSSLAPSFLMCRLARNQVTVALGGDGADELFAGYPFFKNHLALHQKEQGSGRLVRSSAHCRSVL